MTCSQTREPVTSARAFWINWSVNSLRGSFPTAAGEASKQQVHFHAGQRGRVWFPSSEEHQLREPLSWVTPFCSERVGVTEDLLQSCGWLNTATNSLQLLPSSDGIYFPTPWSWAGFMTCFGQENVAKGLSCEFWKLPPLLSCVQLRDGNLPEPEWPRTLPSQHPLADFRDSPAESCHLSETTGHQWRSCPVNRTRKTRNCCCLRACFQVVVTLE